MSQPPLNVAPASPPPAPQPPMPGMAPAAAPPQKGWIRRHLACSITLGCLILLLLGVGAIGTCVWGVMGLIKSSGPYQDALVAAAASPEVTAALGTPIEAGWLVTGNINVSGTSGRAQLAIPISGPKGKGTIYVQATKSAGTWTFDLLQVEIIGRPERIDLLKKEEV